MFLIYYIITYPYKFLTKDETYNMLRNNDNFYNRFNSNDLKVRNVSSIEEYVENIKYDVYNFSMYDKFRISYCCRFADRILRDIEYPWFDGKKASKIKWIFSCTGDYYEYGFPHTILGKIIVLPNKILRNYDNNRLIRTLMHEKVHIYQYKYPDDSKKYIEMNGFRFHEKRGDNIRVNPDIDDSIYKRGNIYYKAEFKENPKKISDVYFHDNKYEYEHPYEEMAISISNYIII